MKTLKILAFCSMLMLAGCQVANDVQESGPKDGQRYAAAMESFGTETRTELEGNQVLWSSGDMIMVFEGNDTGKSYVLDQSYSGRAYGEFVASEDLVAEGSGEETGALVAFYPCSSDLALSCDADGVLTLENVLFPSEQQYVSSSFADASFPMISVGAAEDGELQFRNLGGVLHLKVKGKGSVTKVILESNDGELISGSASVTVAKEGLPVVSMHDDASASVAIVCDPSVVLSETQATDFYFSLPPVEFASGFTVTIDYGEKGSLVKQTVNPQNVKRSSLLHMPEFILADMTGPFVDLGLSVKWASMNVGASSPEEYGNYYAWGETQTKSSFTKGNYVYYDLESRAYMDLGEDISGTEYDAATVNWGEEWRMPTMAELQELVDLCTWAEYRLNRVKGNRITGPNGNSIFIPNSGYWQNSSKYFDNDYPEGSFGLFWSSSLEPLKKEEAYIMNCESGNGIVAYRYWYRHFGLPVRPVKD